MLIRLSDSARLFHADCRDAIKSLPDNSIDSCVTDPPYALVSIVKRFGGPNAQPAKGNDAYMRASRGFMNATWDTGEVAFSEEFWAEVLRVLKPGGHVAAFGASRGYHRMACAIEDAGFEIRDSLMWVYATGFPKSHDVSKGIDRAAGAEREVISSYVRQGRSAGIMGDAVEIQRNITAPATDAARQWEGWGTALKPAFEPICLARKPLSEGTVAANVLRWGTGALNITATRVLPDTTDRFLSRAMQIASHVASELGGSTSYKDPLPNADLFANKLGKLLSAVDTSALFAEHEVSNERIGQLLPGSQEHCPICRHFYDGLVLVPLANDQVSAQLSRYVRTHTRQPKPADGQVAEPLDILRYECMTLLANLDSDLRVGHDSRSSLAALLHAFSEYLKSCLRYTETLLPSQLSFDRADRVARLLVQPIEKIDWADDRKDWDSPLSDLVFNIIVGPYIITNTMSILARCLREKSRWPANVVHDGSDEVVGAFPNTSPSPKGLITQGGDHFSIGSDKKTRGTKFQGHGDSGSAARFFYSAKASRADRNGSKHPTVKPIALMQWLARLITPPGGTVLDPFAGSGTTGAACEREGFNVILCEREDEYVGDIKARFGHERPADWKPQGAGRRIYGVFADEKGVEGGRLDRTPDPLARLLRWNAAVTSYRAKVAA